MRMFRSRGEKSKQQRVAHHRVAISWTWPVGTRLVLAALLFLGGISIQATVFLEGSDSATAYTNSPELVVDPNTAPAWVLEELPHLGPGLVSRLIAAREVRPFRSMDDLRRRVRGFGPATLDRLSPHLRIEPARVPAAQTADEIIDLAPGRPRVAQMGKAPAQ
jgi:competence protein ComEA